MEKASRDQADRIIDQLFRQERSFRSRIQAALFRARVAGGAKCATPRGRDLYTVTGRAGDRYTVLVAGLESDHVRCDCKAGFHGTPCWHAAAAWLRVVADRMAA